MSCVAYEYVVRHVWIRHMSRTNKSCIAYKRVVCYGVATISRLLKIIGLFCKRALFKRRNLANETYNFKEPTNRSHPIRMEAWYEKSDDSWRVISHTYGKFVSPMLGACQLPIGENCGHCNILQHAATHCNTLQHAASHCTALQHTAPHCNALQHTAPHCNTLHHTAPHCTTLHHTAPHCTTLQHTATHCNTLQHTATHCNALQRTATCCDTLRHTATHCNTLRHTATHCNTL